ncbi:uncharacterized protein LOC141532127 isoform X2 [Cotesia typhae]|uniref:uncharacterized protein LOC141532127 isoform X2 n=1 Tax=Cotesia typhae TaxID=2053667 RepID=UPI003D6939A0
MLFSCDALDLSQFGKIHLPDQKQKSTWIFQVDPKFLQYWESGNLKKAYEFVKEMVDTGKIFIHPDNLIESIWRSIDDVDYYIRCHSRRTNGCPAIGKLVDGIPILSTDHNHARNPLLACQHEFQKALYKAATDRPLQSLRLAYDTLCLLHSKAAVTLTWTKMQLVMQRWRSQVLPRHPLQPINLLDYAGLLQQPEWQHFTCYNNNNDRLSVQTVEAADTSSITIIGNRNFLALINPTELFMDATYKIRPKKPKILQIFMIMGLVYNTAVPICWMIMTAKSTLAYTAGLTYFKEELAPHIQPEVIMTDFESSLENAIRSVYPQAKHVGCFFHYCQALMKKFKKFNLLQLCKEWLPGKILMRKVMALALLPHHDVIPAFDWLEANLPVDIRQIFAPFLRYFRSQWINRVRPIKYSVFNGKNRTNNFSEANNRRNKLRFGVHPNIWTFTEKLRDLQAITHIEVLSLFRGETITRDSRSNTLKRDQDIDNAWLLYQQGLLNIQNFLAYASFFLKPAYLNIELDDMDIRTDDDEEEIIMFGAIILQPAEYYLAMDVFQEIDIRFE